MNTSPPETAIRLIPQVVEHADGRLELIADPLFHRNLTATLLRASLDFDGVFEMHAFLTIASYVRALHMPQRYPKKQVAADRRAAERFIHGGEPDALGLTFTNYLTVLGSSSERVAQAAVQRKSRPARQLREREIRRQELRQLFGLSGSSDQRDGQDRLKERDM